MSVLGLWGREGGGKGFCMYGQGVNCRCVERIFFRLLKIFCFDLYYSKIYYICGALNVRFGTFSADSFLSLNHCVIVRR